jgi:hypothetical protein
LWLKIVAEDESMIASSLLPELQEQMFTVFTGKTALKAIGHSARPFIVKWVNIGKDHFSTKKFLEQQLQIMIYFGLTLFVFSSVAWCGPQCSFLSMSPPRLRLWLPQPAQHPTGLHGFAMTHSPQLLRLPNYLLHSQSGFT